MFKQVRRAYEAVGRSIFVNVDVLKIRLEIYIYRAKWLRYTHAKRQDQECC